MTSMLQTRSEKSHSTSGLVLMCLAMLYALACLPLLWLGYGADEDAWLVMRTAHWLSSGEGYAPSRAPGYPLFESIQALLASSGQYVVSNLIALIATACGGFAFWKILKIRAETDPWWILAFFVLHPSVLKNALCTMDYNAALAALLFAYWAFLRKRYWLCGALLGLAGGFRLTSLGFGVVFALAMARQRLGWRAFVATALSATVVAIVAYIPVFVARGPRYVFLLDLERHLSEGYLLVAGAYKALSFCGAFATIAILVALAHALWRRRSESLKAVDDIPFLAVVAYVALFVAHSDETDYLTVIAPFLGLFLVRAVDRRWFRVIVILTLVHGIATLDFVGGPSGQRHFAPHPTLGVLPSDAVQRVRDLRLRERIGNVETTDGRVIVQTALMSMEVNNPNLVPEELLAGEIAIAAHRFGDTDVYVVYVLPREALTALRKAEWNIGYLDIARGRIIEREGYDPEAEGCFVVHANDLAGLPDLPVKKR